MRLEKFNWPRGTSGPTNLNNISDIEPRSLKGDKKVQIRLKEAERGVAREWLNTPSGGGGVIILWRGKM